MTSGNKPSYVVFRAPLRPVYHWLWAVGHDAVSCSSSFVDLLVLFLGYEESLVLSDYLDLVDLLVSLDLVVQLYLVHLVRFRMVFPFGVGGVTPSGTFGTSNFPAGT